MSLAVDKKYINFVSVYFPKFKWKSDKVANCRCVFCGDSAKNKNKMRGSFFPQNNVFFYKCHNCGVAYNVSQILELVSPSLCTEYKLETRWFKGDELKLEPVQKKETVPTHIDIEPLSSLPPTHKARVYVEGRGIPCSHWGNLGYTEDFSQVATQLNPDYNRRFFKEDRLLILIRDKNGIIGIQGRSFSQKSKMKYITLKKEDIEMYYNMNAVDTSKPFYIVEGPFDSMFLPNAVATLGASGFKSIGSKLDDTNGVYIVDNQPLNKDVVNILRYLVEKDKKVCIFPSNIKKKDINDMVSAGIDVIKVISENTFQGLPALVKFNEWKKYEPK